MGRSRGRSSSPARRAPAPSAPKRPAPPPARTSPAPPPAQQSSGGGMMSGLMGTVAQGMAFGTGSAMAHRAVGAVAGSMSGSSDNAPNPEGHYEAAPAPATQQQPDTCYKPQKDFLECLNANTNDISACQFYLDSFNQCKQSSVYQ